MYCLLTKVQEHWFRKSRRHILTIVLVKTIFTMFRVVCVTEQHYVLISFTRLWSVCTAMPFQVNTLTGD